MERKPFNVMLLMELVEKVAGEHDRQPNPLALADQVCGMFDLYELGGDVPFYMVESARLAIQRVDERFESVMETAVHMLAAPHPVPGNVIGIQIEKQEADDEPG